MTVQEMIDFWEIEITNASEAKAVIVKLKGNKSEAMNFQNIENLGRIILHQLQSLEIAQQEVITSSLFPIDDSHFNGTYGELLVELKEYLARLEREKYELNNIPGNKMAGIMAVNNLLSTKINKTKERIQKLDDFLHYK